MARALLLLGVLLGAAAASAQQPTIGHLDPLVMCMEACRVEYIHSFTRVPSAGLIMESCTRMCHQKWCRNAVKAASCSQLFAMRQAEESEGAPRDYYQAEQPAPTFDFASQESAQFARASAGWQAPRETCIAGCDRQYPLGKYPVKPSGSWAGAGTYETQRVQHNVCSSNCRLRFP